MFTSEWRVLKWGPVAGAGTVPSLVDSTGYLPTNCATVASRAYPEEMCTELLAQIERARGLGIVPTHLDTHMGCLMATRELFRVYAETGRAYGIPTMLPREDLQRLAPGLLELVSGKELLIIHPALDGAESTAMAGGTEAYGNRWRQLDYNFVSGAVSDLVAEQKIRLVTWRGLAERWKQRQ